MKTYRIILTTLGFISATLLFSCEESSTATLQDVQLCLNGAAQGSAAACVEKIANDVSPLAYSLRCSAIFIDQGFGDAASFVDALDSINGGSGSCTGGCSSTVTALTALKFDAAGTGDSTVRQANIDAADEAFTQCSRADAKIYTQLASLFNLGTITAMEAINLGAGANPTEDDIKNALENGTLPAATIGNIVTVTYESACADTENASESTIEYCAELQSAISGGATPTEIGQCLLDKLADPAHVCP